MIRQKVSVDCVDLLRLCHSILESIEEVRPKSTSCNCLAKPATEVAKLCVNMLYPREMGIFRKNIENLDWIENSLISCLEISRQIANEEENYFGTFQVSNVKQYFSIINELFKFCRNLYALLKLPL